MIAKIREHESHIETLRRLGEQARMAGVQIFWDEVTRRPFATSRRDPSKLHQVSAISCTCQGFIQTGACGHIGLLLIELGYLPTEPTPPTPIRATTATPAVLCDQCGEAMTHVNGVAFECRCGATYQPDWQVIDTIERAICRADSEEVDQIAAEFLTVAGPRQYGPDPDQNPCREDAPDLLGLHAYPANELPACLIWQADRADVADRIAA